MAKSSPKSPGSQKGRGGTKGKSKDQDKAEGSKGRLEAVQGAAPTEKICPCALQTKLDQGDETLNHGA